METQESFKILGEVFFSLCKSVNTPRSLGLWLLFKAGDFDQLVNMTIDPADYLDAHSFERDYLVTSYLLKNEDLATSYDREAEALRKFKQSEETCKASNARLRHGSPDGALGPVLYMAQRKISAILGDVDLDAIAGLFKWGPGATFDISRKNARYDIKHSNTPTVTASALPMARAVVSRDYHWFDAVTGVRPEGEFSVLNSFFEVVPGNRVVTVPKNAKTDRTIAAEPTLNGFIQQGIGRYIRRRLRRFGVNLNDQGRNQFLASKARDWRLATLDLSAASDTIARELVFSLLPLDWANLLDSVRSPAFKNGETWTTYEKFSSMGNAFTFELETVIFYCLMVSCCEYLQLPTQDCSAYGDDLICPQDACRLVIEVLEHCGFSVNQEKSFVSGQFFESCGKHYFGGTDVTPIYQKRALSGAELLRAHNRLLRFGVRTTFGTYIDSCVRGSCAAIYRNASPQLRRCRIPIGSDSDDGFMVVSSELGSVFRPMLGWHCRTLIKKSRYTGINEKGAYAHVIFSHASPPDVLEDGDSPKRVQDLTTPACSPYSHGVTVWANGEVKSLSVSGVVKRTFESFVFSKRWIVPPVGVDLSW